MKNTTIVDSEGQYLDDHPSNSSYQTQLNQMEQEHVPQLPTTIETNKTKRNLLIIAVVLLHIAIIIIIGVILGIRNGSSNQNNNEHLPSIDPPEDIPLKSSPPWFDSAAAPSNNPKYRSISLAPSDDPFRSPQTENPSDNPSGTLLTNNPSNSPQTDNPSGSPEKQITNNPSSNPSGTPLSDNPSGSPLTHNPSDNPSVSPQTDNPSGSPLTDNPSGSPEKQITDHPSDSPKTEHPSDSPTKQCVNPSQSANNEPIRTKAGYLIQVQKQCLGIDHSTSSRLYRSLYMYPCSGSLIQKWSYDDQTKLIKNSCDTNDCIRVVNAQALRVYRMDVWQCDSTDEAQQWTISGDEIRSVRYSRKCLQVVDKTWRWPSVELKDCDNSEDQKWIF